MSAEPVPSFGDLTLRAFVERLASDEPVPGGGSASAVAASLAAGLVAMVAALSEGRPRYAAHAELHAAVAPAARRLSGRLLDLAGEDAAAYAAFAAALKLPRDGDEAQGRRRAAMQAAARTAAEVPLRCVEACYQVVTLAEALAGRSNTNAASDLNVASLLSVAAARGAAENVFVNLSSVGDPDFEDRTMTAAKGMIDEIERVAATVREVAMGSETRDPLSAVDVAALPGA